MNRRTFVALASAGLAYGAPLPTLRLGGPIFLKSDDPAELAREHRRLGYSAAYCPTLTLDQRDKIEAVRKAFAAQNVLIAEVGAWVNMMDANPELRKKNLAYVTDRLRLAEAVGARNCVNIAGSMNPKQWDGPDPRNYSQQFFDATVENVRKILDDVKPVHAKFSIEMMGWAPPDGPDSYLRLIRAVDRPGFAVHIDVCNIMNSVDKFYRNAAVTTECFQKLGRWVMSCHAKDLWGYRTHLAETIPGRGGIDYAAYLHAIARYAPEAPLMLEHLTKPEEYEEGKQYIQRVAAQSGIAFA
jgi:sugar phosphate isomerase/epimerase